MKKLLGSTLASVLLATMAIPAYADIEWTWTVNKAADNSLLADGLFTTAGPATSPEPVTGISGQYDGHSITGLVPLSQFGSLFYFDQMFTSSGLPFNNNGLLFNVADGVGGVNIYSVGQNLFSYNWGNTPPGANSGNGIGVQFSAVQSPVPEPKTYAMLLSGLGLLAFTTRRRNRIAGLSA